MLTVAAMITDDVAMDTFVESAQREPLMNQRCREVSALELREVEGADLHDKPDHRTPLAAPLAVDSAASAACS